MEHLTNSKTFLLDMKIFDSKVLARLGSLGRYPKTEQSI